MVLASRLAICFACLAITFIFSPRPMLATTFSDYAVKIDTQQKKHPVLLQSRKEKEFSTALREASAGPSNFAGHFVLTSWGCGAGCVMAAAIDRLTGRVSMLPFTVSDWPLDVTDPLSFQKDSSLLIIIGSRDETGHGKYFYNFDGRNFKLIETEKIQNMQ